MSESPICGECIYYKVGMCVIEVAMASDDSDLSFAELMATTYKHDACTEFKYDGGGVCPVSRYEWLSSDGCAEKCGTVTEEECWIAYLTGKRLDESGAEVDR